MNVPQQSHLLTNRFTPWVSLPTSVFTASYTTLFYHFNRLSFQSKQTFFVLLDSAGNKMFGWSKNLSCWDFSFVSHVKHAPLPWKGTWAPDDLNHFLCTDLRFMIYDEVILIMSLQLRWKVQPLDWMVNQEGMMRSSCGKRFPYIGAKASSLTTQYSTKVGLKHMVRMSQGFHFWFSVQYWIKGMEWQWSPIGHPESHLCAHLQP